MLFFIFSFHFFALRLPLQSGLKDVSMLLRSKQRIIEMRQDFTRLNEGIKALDVAVLNVDGVKVGNMVFLYQGLDYYSI